MARRVKLKSHHHDVVFEFTKHGLYVHTSCCGAPVPRRKAKKLSRLLKVWLAQH